MDKLTMADITVGMQFRSLIPIESENGIKFPEGSYFRVIEMVFNSTFEDKKGQTMRYLVVLVTLVAFLSCDRMPSTDNTLKEETIDWTQNAAVRHL